MPKVTVVIPSYNHARYLPLTLEGVTSQSFTDWELVIVDDGSTDGTVQILREIKDPRITWSVNKHNLGTYETLNRGLDLAQGEYIAILNSDDLWAPEKLSAQMALLARHPEAGICYTAPVQILDDGSLREPQDHHDTWPTDEIQRLVAREIGVNRVLASSAVFRRGLLRFDSAYRYSGDWIAMLGTAAATPFAFVSEPLTSWRIHAENAHKHIVGATLEETSIRQGIVNAGRFWFQTGEPTEAIYAALVENVLRLHALYLLCGDAKRARLALRAATEAGISNPTIQKRLNFAFLPVSLQRSRVWPGTDSSTYEIAYSHSIPQPPEFVSPTD